MCATCGCSDDATVSIDGAHQHHLENGTVVTHTHHDHDHHHHDDHHHHHDHGAHEHQPPDGRVIRHTHQAAQATAKEHAPQLRRVAIEEDVMAKNDRAARVNRERFASDQTFVVNLMSSPGSGKTTLLVKTLEALRSSGRPLAVIEGDQQTSLDAERIRATGVPAVQVNTGKGCHLDAEMVHRALTVQALAPAGTLFIENVGNLVCPAGFDLGESRKVVIASVTEGEEKPLKYPDMFAAADVVVVNKIDLVDVLGFDLEALEHNIRRVNAHAVILRVSARSGQGFAGWLDWLRQAPSAPRENSAP